MGLFTALLAAHVISSASSCNQVVVKTIKGAVCGSLDFDNEINSKITFETGCTYIVTNCDITASAAGEMEHKAGSKFVMRGDTTFTLNGTARVAGGIDIEGGTYLNKNLLLISETGVFRVHQNGEATNSKTGSFYIAGDFVNENLFTNLGADSDGDNSGVPFGVSNDGTMTNHKNITNLGTMKNKGTIRNEEGGIINNERLPLGPASCGSDQESACSTCLEYMEESDDAEEKYVWIIDMLGSGQPSKVWCNNGWGLVARVTVSDNQAHFNQGAVGVGEDGVNPTSVNTQKFSDSAINNYRGRTTYSGTTGYWITGYTGCGNGNMWCSRQCPWDATARVDRNDACWDCTPTDFEAPNYNSYLTYAPNPGSFGIGHHHSNDGPMLAWMRHPEQGYNSGFRSDQCGGHDGLMYIR